MVTLTETRYRFQPLTLQPINVSLTEGTSTPCPTIDSLPSLNPSSSLSIETPRRSGSPPSPHGGPLSSHPASPTDLVFDIPFALSPIQYRPRSSVPAFHRHSTALPLAYSSISHSAPPHSPMSQSSGTSSSETNRSGSSRPSSSWRKSPLLRSLSNLYTASSESLASLYQRGEKRPSKARVASMPLQGGTSVSVGESSGNSVRARPSYSRKASGSWFRRRSGMWGDLNAVDLAEEPVVLVEDEDKENEDMGRGEVNVDNSRKSLSSREMLDMGPPVLPSLRCMGLGEDVGDLGGGDWLKDIH